MLLPPPIPGPLSFHALLTDTAGHTRDIADANAARARLRTVLKATRKAGAAGGGDWAGAVNATSDYLPHLYAILACVESDDLLLKEDPVFTWRSSLSSQMMKKGHPRIALPSLHYELAAVLLTHGICLANQSATLISSLGSYEISSSVSTAAIKVHDETVNLAAEMLCRASGVFTHLADVVIPRWETAVGEGIRGRPVELGRDVVSALAKLCLADANLLAIRRLLSRSLSVAHSTTTPGPPLPPSHPSPSLLAKLHLNVYGLYDEARSLVKGSTRSGDSTGEISPEVRRYLSDGRSLAQALSWKWLGVDCGENHGMDKSGEALGWLAMAKNTLEEVQGKSAGLKSLKIGKGKSAGKGRKGKVAEELDSTAAFASAYKKVNDTVSFQPVPPAATLLPRVPAGRAALAPKAYVAPAPAFHPTTGDHPRQIPPPPLNSDLDASALDLNGDSSDDGGDGDYYGAGQYF